MIAASADTEVAVVGAGVVGCAVALTLARRGVTVFVLEAESAPGLGASGTNSGILHTGFDSPPGELETELILASTTLRDQVVDALQVPLLRCGALMRPQRQADRQAIDALAARAECNGVKVVQCDDGALEVPGEAVTDPVLYTLALAEAAQRLGAQMRMCSAVESIDAARVPITVRTASGETVRTRVLVNCAGLHADEVARAAGDDSFSIYPRKGEFLVYTPPPGAELGQILLPVPSQHTKGVLVFPTLDGKVVAGPTAVDQDDKTDWSPRAHARDEILRKAIPMYPPLADAELVAEYAGLRPAGRGVNYLIAPSTSVPRLVNVAAIRSTGLTASLGIAQKVAELVRVEGVSQAAETLLPRLPSPRMEGPWWRRTSSYRTAA